MTSLEYVTILIMHVCNCVNWSYAILYELFHLVLNNEHGKVLCKYQGVADKNFQIKMYFIFFYILAQRTNFVTDNVIIDEIRSLCFESWMRLDIYLQNPTPVSFQGALRI